MQSGIGGRSEEPSPPDKLPANFHVKPFRQRSSVILPSGRAACQWVWTPRRWFRGNTRGSTKSAPGCPRIGRVQFLKQPGRKRKTLTIPGYQHNDNGLARLRRRSAFHILFSLNVHAWTMDKDANLMCDLGECAISRPFSERQSRRLYHLSLSGIPGRACHIPGECSCRLLP